MVILWFLTLIFLGAFAMTWQVSDTRKPAQIRAIRCCGATGPILFLLLVADLFIWPPGFWGPSDSQGAMILSWFGGAVVISLVGIVWAFVGKPAAKGNGFTIEPVETPFDPM